MRCTERVYYAVLTNDSAPPPGFTGRGAVGTAYGRRAWPLRLAWKSAIAFLIFAWFSGLRASWITLAAMAEVASFLSMPAMLWPPRVGQFSPCPNERALNHVPAHLTPADTRIRTSLFRSTPTPPIAVQSAHISRGDHL